ncbi:hypothetical protein ACLK1T_12000 [Escherichia coli]
MLAVTIPEEKGSFLKFCELLGKVRSPNSPTALPMPKTPASFGVRLSRGLEEREEILQMLNDGGYSVVDLSRLKWQSYSALYGWRRPSHPLQERLYSFEFPESPVALLRFLNTLGTHGIFLAPYRSHGTTRARNGGVRAWRP